MGASGRLTLICRTLHPPSRYAVAHSAVGAFADGVLGVVGHQGPDGRGGISEGGDCGRFDLVTLAVADVGLATTASAERVYAVDARRTERAVV